MNRAASPSRTPRRRAQPQTWKPARDRKEIVITVLVVLAICAGTALMIWLLRPESKPGAGDGGILSQQARIAWWLVIIVAVLAIGYGVGKWLARGKRLVGVAIGVVVALLVAVPLGIKWPGGLRVPQPEPPTAPPPQALGPLLPNQPEPFPAPPTTTAPAPAPTPAPAPG